MWRNILVVEGGGAVKLAITLVDCRNGNRKKDVNTRHKSGQQAHLSAQPQGALGGRPNRQPRLGFYLH